MHDHNYLTFVKFCLFGDFSVIIVVLQVTVLFNGHMLRFFGIAVLCFYRLFFLRERFQIIRLACREMRERQK